MVLYRFFRMLFRFIFAVFYRWEIVGKENVPDHGAVLLVANHISNWDPPFLGSPIERQVRFMAKAELFKIPVLSYVITAFGAFPVKRGAGDRQALRTVFQLLENGEVLGLFPEGTRSKTGELEAGHSGAAVFALRSGAKVVPTAIIGPFKLFRSAKIVYGKPLDLSHYPARASKEQIAAATAEIMGAIEELIREHRR